MDEGTGGNSFARRLNKVLAESGIASRRKADELIFAGAVSVDGVVETNPGRRVDPARERVAVNGAPLSAPPAQSLLFMLNKPAGVVTTASDPQGRRTVLDLFPRNSNAPGSFPWGRLDYFSEGLLLLTTDGELCHGLTHPSRHLEKVYRVEVRGEVPEEALSRMRAGMVLAEGEALAPVKAERLPSPPGRTVLGLTLILGVNRQIRRMCRDLGLTILTLRRVSQGPLALAASSPGPGGRSRPRRKPGCAGPWAFLPGGPPVNFHELMSWASRPNTWNTFSSPNATCGWRCPSTWPWSWTSTAAWRRSTPTGSGSRATPRTSCAGNYLIEFMRFEDRERVLAQIQGLITADIATKTWTSCSCARTARTSGCSGAWPSPRSTTVLLRGQGRDRPVHTLRAAYHDSLTGLPNRLYLTDYLPRILSRADQDGKQVAVLFIDLDGFKQVNDTLGHRHGDALLVQVGQRMKKVLSSRDVAARLGGDEFVCLLFAPAGTAEVEHICAELLKA